MDLTNRLIVFLHQLLQKQVALFTLVFHRGHGLVYLIDATQICLSDVQKEETEYKNLVACHCTGRVVLLPKLKATKILLRQVNLNTTPRVFTICYKYYIKVAVCLFLSF